MSINLICDAVNSFQPSENLQGMKLNDYDELGFHTNENRLPE